MAHSCRKIITAMYRTILFRAKRTKADDPQERFIEGSLLSFQDIHGKRVCSIVSDAGKRNEIQLDTIGEFTGLYDKNGTPIYEDDIVRNVKGLVKTQSGEYEDDAEVFAVKHEDARFNVSYYARVTGSLEVIGNIYDNPELIK